MLYAVLRRFATLAVRWYYREVVIDGADRVPHTGPALLVANHPNELMDAIFAGLVAGRQLTFTGKATLFENPVMAVLLRHLRVVPLRRAQDERRMQSGSAPEADRNATSFAAVNAALADGQMVLVFPEGLSWDEPRLAPIKTGAARMAFAALDAGVHALQVVPVGINYEQKEGVRSRVLVEVGTPLHVRDWVTEAGRSVELLTEEIAERLHNVTMNFSDADEAETVRAVASVLATPLDSVRPLSDPDTPLSVHVSVARQAAALRTLERAGRLPTSLRDDADQVQRRLLSLRRAAGRLDIRVDDVALDTRPLAALRTALHEGLVAVVGAPLAAWGRINNFVPFRLATSLGNRLATVRSQPAMNTVVIGVLLIPLFYLLQTLLVWKLSNWMWAMLYLASLIPSASWDLQYRARLRRLAQRARAWRAFRADPTFQSKLITELRALRGEALRIAEATGLRSGA
jgi:glycerol-3-phosphate O-acyltransferase / dihydroxyacetone phosphate acyltransferase